MRLPAQAVAAAPTRWRALLLAALLPRRRSAPTLRKRLPIPLPAGLPPSGHPHRRQTHCHAPQSRRRCQKDCRAPPPAPETGCRCRACLTPCQQHQDGLQTPRPRPKMPLETRTGQRRRPAAGRGPFARRTPRAAARERRRARKGLRSRRGRRGRHGGGRRRRRIIETEQVGLCLRRRLCSRRTADRHLQSALHVNAQHVVMQNPVALQYAWAATMLNNTVLHMATQKYGTSPCTSPCKRSSHAQPRPKTSAQPANTSRPTSGKTDNAASVSAGRPRARLVEGEHHAGVSGRGRRRQRLARRPRALAAQDLAAAPQRRAPLRA